MKSVLNHPYSKQDMAATQPEQVDDNDTNQAKHLVDMASNLLDLQKSGTFCDVYFSCSNGYVKGNL